MGTPRPPLALIGPWLDDARTWADRALERMLRDLDGAPPTLAEAIRYALLGGGKRLRPAVLRLVVLHFGGRDEDAVHPAAAVECVHAYSLVHDDLPCMDDDDLRRGRPTCHRVYGEALAILAGDALLTFAFGLLARTGDRAAEHARVLAEGAGHRGMVGGQVLDLAAEAVPSGRAAVEEIHAKKTAALFAAAAEMGAIAARADSAGRAAAKNYGLALGRCFQATDDVLDVTGDADSLGKTPGKDAREKKPTLVAALGLEGARAEAKHLAERAREAARALPRHSDDLALNLVDEVLRRTR
ncbi:MAG TPA: farnesyl diphosphate synthase [Planctomycetota bacterium]|jgi:farnesyl diphosphate synthase|nr:farnesyl diphosphate synthase [Planctomycetota bacterium]